MLYIASLLLAWGVATQATNVHLRAAGTNVAQGKTASQSSIWSVTNPASFAVDGDTSSTFRIGGHCAHMGYENMPWVMVDLGASYTINSVELWTREKNMGASYAARDRDMEIRVGDSPFHENNPVCVKFDGLVPVKAEASCGQALCGRYISVQRKSPGMNYMHVCEIKAFSIDNKAGCVNEDALSGKCSCTGDPHCFSFDGKWLHYQGACIYTIAQDGCEDGQPGSEPSWSVTANFDRFGGSVSYTKQVTVTLSDKDMVIDLLENKVVLINGKKALGSPQTFDGVVVSITPNQVYVTVDGGIRVQWDGVYNLYVQVRESMKGNLCGLCGNFDGSAANDWTVGPSDLCMDAYDNAVPGQLTTDINTMGASWTAAIDSNEQVCIDECPVKPPPPANCPTGDINKAEAHCAPLKDTNGPFKACLAKMDEFQKKDLYDNCVYDSCHLNDYETVVCDHGVSMSMICNAMYDIPVEWRSEGLCPIECGENMEYNACGEPCTPTCSDIKGEECGDLGPCTEGCFCKPGYVFDNAGKCIKEEQCGCLVEDQGVYIKVGESVMKDDCSAQCTCEAPQGKLQCVENVCPKNTVCGVLDGEAACVCNPPFIEVKGKCIEYENPCTTAGGNDEDQKVQCLTCKNAGSEEECEKNGQMETCAEDDAICAVTITKSKSYVVRKVNRQCVSRADCPPEMVGPKAEVCQDKSGTLQCSNCGYGPLQAAEKNNPVYSCYTEPKTTTTTTTPAPATTTPDVDVCYLKKPKGAGNEERWFFSVDKCKCNKIKYMATTGENNFASEEQCLSTCTGFDTPAECLVKKDPGPCDKFKKYYYYEEKAQKCKKFNYGGCEGNSNRFKKKEDCRAKCKKC